MSTTKKAPKAGTKDYQPTTGICCHRNAAKLYDCEQPVGKPHWTWCAAHVKAHAESKRAAVKKAAPAPAQPIKSAPTAKVAGTSMDRELAAVEALRDAPTS